MAKRKLVIYVSDKTMMNLIQLADFSNKSVAKMVDEMLSDLDAEQIIGMCNDRRKCAFIAFANDFLDM